MDVGVVTPIKDGMNLVAKEMLICNPRAALILSSGAGTEVQLGNAGFYDQERQCYFRIDDIGDVQVKFRVFTKKYLKDKKIHLKKKFKFLSDFCGHFL